MPDFQEGRFHTPPLVDPLNLDLKTLEGGGYAPSQFWGETHDGRKIYCRYRGGRLTIDLADRPGAELDDDGVRLLTVGIGPELAGSMPLFQLCQIAGLTINGVQPPAPVGTELLKSGADDLSGRTTFFALRHDSTPRTARRLLSFVEEIFGSLQCIGEPTGFDETLPATSIAHETTRDVKSADVYFLPFSEIDAVSILNARILYSSIPPREGAPKIRVNFDGFEVGPYRKYHIGYLEDAEQILGRPVYVPLKDHKLGLDSLMISGEFLTSDERARRSFALLEREFLNCYPSYQIEYIDLGSQMALDQDAGEETIDVRVADWLLSGRDRYLDFEKLDFDGKSVLVGRRPKFS